jgi:hypothetical protein
MLQPMIVNLINRLMPLSFTNYILFDRLIYIDLLRYQITAPSLADETKKVQKQCY